MAKFCIKVIDPTLRDNNGGSLVLWHHLHALEQLGHEVGEVLELNEPIPEDADFVMFQGEWWDTVKNTLRNSKAKRICWVGHYNTHEKYAMPKLENIEADFYHTQYEGQAVGWGERVLGRKKIHYLPHAGCNKCNIEGKTVEKVPSYINGKQETEMIEVPKKVIVRNPFPEREEDWLDYAGVTKILTPFENVKDIYKSAIVCPNLHGDFQKNKATLFFQEPAYMINERLFQIILSGGFAISDNNPIAKNFFTDDEVPYAETKIEFKNMIDFFIAHPDERIPYMERAKARILKEHLYIHRWEEFLKIIL